MSYDSDFTANPRDFLNNYAIVPTGGKFVDQSGKKIVTGYFTLTEYKGVEPGGKAKAVLQLSRTQDESAISAYWLAFEDSKAKRAVLGTAAPFMFTANMDGCSFGYGSKTGTGEVLVSHANAADHGVLAEEAAFRTNPADDVLPMARFAQANEQAAMLGKKMQPGTLRILHATEYSDPFNATSRQQSENVFKYAATVVGLLEQGQWKFLCQRRVITTSGQFVLRDVIAI